MRKELLHVKANQNNNSNKKTLIFVFCNKFTKTDRDFLGVLYV